jgi:hypothetical protein
MMLEVTWANYEWWHRVRWRAAFDEKARTMANGNCNSMNRLMAGNMTSLVRGWSETMAAVAKELKATRIGMPLHRVMLKLYTQRLVT